MKSIAILLAAAGLTGCVAYPSQYGSGYYGQGAYYAPGAYYGSTYAQPYVVEPSISIYGTTQYRGGHGYSGGRGDRDHDGIANRYDRDRDGDGVPNRADRRPDDRRRN